MSGPESDALSIWASLAFFFHIVDPLDPMLILKAHER